MAIAPYSLWKERELINGDLNFPTNYNLGPWLDEVVLSKIRAHHRPNILLWVHSMLGTLNIKEAYKLMAKFHLQPNDKIWPSIWKSNLSPKVSIFFWLVVQNCILTWDNLRKRGFIGPSSYPLCSKQEESMENLLNQCLFSANIWGSVTQDMIKR